MKDCVSYELKEDGTKLVIISGTDNEVSENQGFKKEVFVVEKGIIILKKTIIGTYTPAIVVSSKLEFNE